MGINELETEEKLFSLKIQRIRGGRKRGGKETWSKDKT